MRPLPVLLLLLAVACAPSIAVVPASAVARTERRAREVPLCRLVQERDVRPGFTGVEDATGPWQYTIASVAVQHPSGLVVIDPAFGTGVGQDLARAGPLVTLVLGGGRTKRPLVEVMREAGLDPADARLALVTHAHWDHVGALGDLPNARVLMSRAELTWTAPFKRFLDHGVMPHSLKRAKDRLATFAFTGPAMDGFPASFDVFGDGSIVGVPLPGHTPGSAGWLVRGPGGVTYLFSGDATWTSRGVEKPAHKTFRAYDEDLEALSQTLGVLHALHQARPDIVIIPAHDAAALEQLPACGAR
jgi:glyoxylase-like metal-dependent hydrolase (beta-lactamase superfamily II)